MTAAVIAAGVLVYFFGAGVARVVARDRFERRGNDPVRCDTYASEVAALWPIIGPYLLLMAAARLPMLAGGRVARRLTAGKRPELPELPEAKVVRHD